MGPDHVLDKGYRANGAIRQFRAVEFAANDQVTESNAAGEFVLGIAQDEVAAADANNQIVNVRILGISRCIAGAAITRGARVTVDAEGRVVAAAPAAGVNANIVGIAMIAAAAAGDHVDVLLTPGVSLQGA